MVTCNPQDLRVGAGCGAELCGEECASVDRRLRRFAVGGLDNVFPQFAEVEVVAYQDDLVGFRISDDCERDVDRLLVVNGV